MPPVRPGKLLCRQVGGVHLLCPGQVQPQRPRHLRCRVPGVPCRQVLGRAQRRSMQELPERNVPALFQGNLLRNVQRGQGVLRVRVHQHEQLHPLRPGILFGARRIRVLRVHGGQVPQRGRLRVHRMQPGVCGSCQGIRQLHRMCTGALEQHLWSQRMQRVQCWNLLRKSSVHQLHDVPCRHLLLQQVVHVLQVPGNDSTRPASLLSLCKSIF